MSHLSTSTEYGASYDVLNATPLSENEKALYERVEVNYSKDKEGKTLDKKCLVFFLKGGNGRRKYGALDRNSKLEIGQEVDINSVKEIELSNGSDKIWRYDGVAM